MRSDIDAMVQQLSAALDVCDRQTCRGCKYENQPDCIIHMAAETLLEQGVRLPEAAPLTARELRRMDGEIVYCEDLDMDMIVHAPPHDWITVGNPDHPGDCTALAKNLTLWRRRHGERS